MEIYRAVLDRAKLAAMPESLGEPARCLEMWARP